MAGTFTERCPRALLPIANRPYLVIALGIGLVIYFAGMSWIPRNTTRMLVGWNCGVVAFLGLTFLSMRNADLATIKRRAIEHDEGGHLILLLTVFAAIASIGALVAELALAKGRPNSELRVALAAGTVVLSWLFVQIVFATHYAHVYYLSEETTGDHKGGLEFGDDDEPDYWDFVHFSIVMGATSQTADIVIRSKEMRRVGTIHTLVAFGFNTAILATMINLAANLF